jgi:hypothetical protein
MASTSQQIKDPDAILDYVFDWSDWLETSETISDYTLTPTVATSGIAVDDDSETGGKITAWVSGGLAGVTYSLTCHVVTSLGREDDRTMNFVVQDR